MSQENKHITQVSKRINGPLARLSVLFVSLALSACNSVFYQPDRFVYSLPNQFTQNFEEFFIPVEGSNEKIHVWKLHSSKPRRGTILHFHGNAQNMSAHVWFVAWLIDAGYDVITFDYRGYGKSEGHASRENTIKDGHTILKWVAQQANHAPLFVIGQSLGGAVSYASVATVSPPIALRGMIVESSFPSYRQLAQKKLSSFFLTWPLQWPLSFLVTDEWSPRDFLLQPALPLLFIHGTADFVIPYSEGVKFAEKAARDNNDVSFYTDMNRGHTSCFSSLADSRCVRRVLEFLNGLTPEHNSEAQTKGGQK